MCILMSMHKMGEMLLRLTTMDLQMHRNNLQQHITSLHIPNLLIPSQIIPNQIVYPVSTQKLILVESPQVADAAQNRYSLSSTGMCNFS